MATRLTSQSTAVSSLYIYSLLSLQFTLRFSSHSMRTVFLVASSWHPREDVCNKSCVSTYSWNSTTSTPTSSQGSSQGCRRVGRVGEDVGVGVVECGLTRGLWRTTRHTDRRQHYTAADRRPTNQVSAWQAGWGSRPTRTTCYGHHLEYVTRMLRGNRSRGI